ncbi:MAG: O-antigen ligase family protein [Acholeplasmataceae bacterium]
MQIGKRKKHQWLDDFRSIKNIDDFFQFFSKERLSKIALYLLIIWSVIPLFLMILSIFLDRSSAFSFMFNSGRLTIIWYMVMQQIGYLGIIMTVIIILSSLRNKSKNKIPTKIYVFEHKVELFLLLFLLWSLISSLFSSDQALSFLGTDYRKDGWLSYLSYSGFFGLGYLLFKEKDIIRLLRFLGTVASILGVLLIVNMESINEIFTFYHKSTVFYNPNHMGYYLVISILSLTYLAIRKPKIDTDKVICYILFSILVVALIENGSFGPYIAVSMGLLFLMIMTFVLEKNKLIHSISITILFIGISVIMNFESSFLSNEINHLSEGIDDIIEDKEDADRAGSGRWGLWTNGIEFMLDKPVTGYGIENLENAYLEVDIIQDRPHNEFIQIAATTGIIGLLLYVSALGFHFLDFFKLKKKITYDHIGILMIVFGYLVSSFFGNSMFYTTPFFIMILGISKSMIAHQKALM